MRTSTAVLGAGILVVLVAGCGQAGGASAGSGGSVPGSILPTAAPTTVVTTPPVSRPPGDTVPVGGTAVPAGQVDASALPGGFPRVVWTDQSGTGLGFYGEDGGCFTSGAKLDAQTDTSVTVRLIQQEGPIGHMCPLYLRLKPMNVTLAAPLGTRTVVLQLSIVRS